MSRNVLRGSLRGAFLAGVNLVAVAAMLAGLAAPCRAANFSGTLSQAGVAWISDDSRPAALPEAQVRNTHKTFVPDLLVITAGSFVRFPNDDPFFHSIYSEGGPDAFDIGFYDNGPGKVIEFAKPGVNLVRCHIHGAMHATIVVVDGPWAQTRADNERYTLTNVRPGNHVLHTWSPVDGEKSTPLKL